jgi:hypothetical protein
LTFIKAHTIYHSWIHPLHHSPSSLPRSSFLFMYSHVHTLFGPFPGPPPQPPPRPPPFNLLATVIHIVNTKNNKLQSYSTLYGDLNSSYCIWTLSQKPWKSFQEGGDIIWNLYCTLLNFFFASPPKPNALLLQVRPHSGLQPQCRDHTDFFRFKYPALTARLLYTYGLLYH